MDCHGDMRLTYQTVGNCTAGGCVTIIMEDLAEDPVNTVLKMQYNTAEDRAEFWNDLNERISDWKTVKIVPTDIYTPDHRRVRVYHPVANPENLIAIIDLPDPEDPDTEGYTTVAWKISEQDVIDHMSPKAILLNEGFNDMMLLRCLPSYRKKLKGLRLLEVLQDRLAELEKAEAEKEKSEQEEEEDSEFWSLIKEIQAEIN